MNYHEIFENMTSDLLVYGEKENKIYLLFSHMLKEKMKGSKITIEFSELKLFKLNLSGNWIFSISNINIHLNTAFISDHFINKTSDFDNFLQQFIEAIDPLTKTADTLRKSKPNKSFDHFAPLSIFYLTKDNYIFQFRFEPCIEGKDYCDAFLASLNTIYRYEQESYLVETIKSSYTNSSNIIYFTYCEGSWTVLDPLLGKSNDINYSYRKKKDFRIKKPMVIQHEDDFNKHFVFDNNWALNFDGLNTLLIQPNDVTLYSNLSQTNLKQAESFYHDTIIPRHKYYTGAFPSSKKQKEYFDYFELIISAVIFSYTSLEAFANICIPDDYEYLEEKNGIKTYYSKQAIERKFSLRDKFKRILKEILNTTEVSGESWWNDFIKLEDLRDEIIHTKQSKSEDRYSKLLSMEIFDLVNVNKSIIQFFGHFILLNKKELLKEYPYDFDFDCFLPSLTSNEDYKQMYYNLFNPSGT